MSSKLFTLAGNGQAITRHKYAHYKQLRIYEREGFLFVKHGAAYIKLYDENRTGDPNVHLIDIVDIEYKVGAHGGLTHVTE